MTTVRTKQFTEQEAKTRALFHDQDKEEVDHLINGMLAWCGDPDIGFEAPGALLEKVTAHTYLNTSNGIPFLVAQFTFDIAQAMTDVGHVREQLEKLH